MKKAMKPAIGESASGGKSKQITTPNLRGLETLIRGVVHSELEPIRKEIGGLATKKELEGLATKKELEELATKKDLEGLATKKELEGLATKKDLEKVANDLTGLRQHTDSSFEQVHAEIKDLVQHFNQSQVEQNRHFEGLLREHHESLIESINEVIINDKLGSLERRVSKLEAAQA